MNSGALPGLGQNTIEIQYPYNQWIDHISSIPVRGGVINMTGMVIPASQFMHHTVSQNPTAQYDEWVNYFFVEAGNFQLYLVHTMNTDNGILSLYLDGTEIAVKDLYAGVTTNNQQITINNLSLARGMHELRGIARSKNASSSNYRMPISGFFIKLMEPLRP